jgi:hypothetical protein
MLDIYLDILQQRIGEKFNYISYIKRVNVIVTTKKWGMDKPSTFVFNKI